MMHTHTCRKNTHRHKIIKTSKIFLLKELGLENAFLEYVFVVYGSWKAQFRSLQFARVLWMSQTAGT